MNKYFFLLNLLFSCALNAQQEQPAFIRDSLDIYVQRALQNWRIPGCAVGIIKNGKIILAKGYGVRDIHTQLPVDERTLFMIASNTKEVTGSILAKLESENKLSLNDRVIKWLPDFKLFDPNATKLVTIKDVVTHRIGFETFQGDFCHWSTNTSRDEVIKRMGKIKPIYDFRDKWGYCNAGYVVAGKIIEKASGMKWEDYVSNKYFKPMEMKETIPLSVNLSSTPNHCTPHTIYKNNLISLRIPDVDNLAPAASICSSISEWSKWVLMLLNNGKYNNQEIIPAKAIQKTMDPVSYRSNFAPPFNSGHFALYGLGWVIQDYASKKIVSHTGGADGFVTSVTLIPEDSLGIIVFTNTDANSFFLALKSEIMDSYLGLPYRNYSDLSLKRYKAADEKKVAWLKSVEDSVKMNMVPAIPLSRFTGTYKNEVYGIMKIETDDTRLKIFFEHHPNQHAILEYMGNNRFLCTYSNPTLGIKVFPFEIKNNKVKSVIVSCDDFVEFTNYVFVKK